MKLLTKFKNLEEHLTASASQIVHDLNCDISIRTMRRMLKQLGYCYQSTLKAPLLTPEHIIFWENLRRRWSNAVFVDECTFVTHKFPKKAYQKRGRRVMFQCTNRPAKVQVWGSISLRGKTLLHIFTQNLNSSLYRKTMWTKLLQVCRGFTGKSGGTWSRTMTRNIPNFRNTLMA